MILIFLRMDSACAISCLRIHETTLTSVFCNHTDTVLIDIPINGQLHPLEMKRSVNP